MLKASPQVKNVVCTASLDQTVDITKLANMQYGIYDKATYGGRCGYVKTPQMVGRVTVFKSGKMISVGGKSVEQSTGQLNDAKAYLLRENMIRDIPITPKIRNIVAVLDLGLEMPINKIAPTISGAVYEPEMFPGMIIRGLNHNTFLVFASGRIVITGVKTMDELHTASFDLINVLMRHEV